MNTAQPLKGVILNQNPATTKPKCWYREEDMLIPIANVPLIEWILEGYKQVGIRETLISIGPDSHQISTFCGDGSRWNMTLTYNDENTTNFTNILESQISTFTEKASLLVTLGPILLGEEVYRKAVCQLIDNPSKCICLWQNYIEDTSPQTVSLGVYLLSSNMYQQLCKISQLKTWRSGFDQIPYLSFCDNSDILKLAVSQQPYSAQSPEIYLDSNKRMIKCGNQKNFIPKIIADNFSSPNLVLRPPVLVAPKAELERCQIGPGVCLGHGVYVGHGTIIENSVVMPGADIGDGASISHAIIGRNETVENRSVIHGNSDQVITVPS